MKQLAPALFVALLALGLAPTALAGLYKWTDADGTLHVTGDLEAVPAAKRDAALRDARARPELIRSKAQRARAASPDSPRTVLKTPKNAGDEWQTLGADRRAKREALEVELEELRARKLELEEAGADVRPPSNTNGKISPQRLRRYRDRHNEWKRVEGDIRIAERRLDALP